MVLEIAIGSKADRFLQSVNQQTFERLSNEIKELAVNPHPRNAKKVLTEEGVLRVRVGIYRILYSLEDNLIPDFTPPYPVLTKVPEFKGELDRPEPESGAPDGSMVIKFDSERVSLPMSFQTVRVTV